MTTLPTINTSNLRQSWIDEALSLAPSSLKTQYDKADAEHIAKQHNKD